MNLIHWQLSRGQVEIIEEDKILKRCIECQKDEARHWASSYCESCFTVILNEKFEEGLHADTNQKPEAHTTDGEDTSKRRHDDA